MSTQVERNQLKEFYSNSPKWVVKVDKMTDAQVIAVLRRLQLKKS